MSRLTPYVEYEIRVRAHNAAGDGPLSGAQVCRTDEDGTFTSYQPSFCNFLMLF